MFRKTTKSNGTTPSTTTASNTDDNNNGGGPLRRFRRKKRSLSAPPFSGRFRRRHRILEDHFRVDAVDDQHPKQLVVLPGVPHHDDDWARDSHDFFNLAILIPVVALNVMNWNWDLMLYRLTHAYNNHPKGNHNQQISFEDAWTGEWFHWFWGVTASYFLVDLIWILIAPSCVKSPIVIIQHHVATILYILVPLLIPEYRWCMGACMSVEINTWFLIARRVFNKQGFPPWIIDLSFVSIRVKLISIFFYLTWIVIRCILYPSLMLPFYEKWLAYSAKVGTKWNIVLLCVPLHASFCLLNLKWSYDLLMSKLRYWRRRSRTSSKDNDSKGL